jgi:hypothetical protein
MRAMERSAIIKRERPIAESLGRNRDHGGADADGMKAPISGPGV